MYLTSILALLTLTASSCEGAVPHTTESNSRNLAHHTTSCEDIAGFVSRCCGDDLSHCEYPFREWWFFETYWEHTCAITDSNYASSCLSDIVETAIDAGSFNTLAAALTAADLVGALSAPNGPYTVFAPTDDAFDALPPILVECLTAPQNKDALTSILLYHVVSGQVLSSDLSDGQVVETLNGEDVTVDLSSGVKINTSPVSSADILASNGVIHVIDSVLVPPSVDVAAFLATCTGEPAPAPAPAPASDLPDIVQTAIDAGSFNTLATALTAAKLVGALSTPNGPYTVFAPTDDAFAALPSGLVECLLEPENKDVLTSILLYHVVSGQVLSSDLSNGLVAETLSGEDVTVDLSSGVKINTSPVSAADILASNGVIHVIDSVLVPPSVDVAAFLATCDEPAVDPAPVPGVSDFIQTVIDSGSITPEPSTSPAPLDIVQTAIDAGSFNTLAAALTAAKLVGALSTPNGPYTVFAPTDDAFAALPSGLVECLLQSENRDVLSSILLYHVVAGQVLSSDLSNGLVAETLSGEDITVDLTSGVKINTSPVSAADILASNGVIHVIDSVLVPPSVDVAAFLETC